VNDLSVVVVEEVVVCNFVWILPIALYPMDFGDIIVFLLIVFLVIAVGAKYLYKVLNAQLKIRGKFVKGVDCLLKNSGKVLIYTLNKTFSLFFTGCKLCPPGIGIETTVDYYLASFLRAKAATAFSAS